jgi:primosomal protein N' (replication factor Y)
MYPPFAEMIRCVARGPRESTTSAFADRIAEELVARIDARGLEARVLGPAPAPIAKLRGQFRFHLQAQAADGEQLREAMRQATEAIKPADDVQWAVDIDPLDMM